jgi:rubrerythrin
MSFKSNLTDLRRRFFRSSQNQRQAILDDLRHRFIDEKQHAARFTQHAERMRYPQFRQGLLRVAEDEPKHATLLATKIKELGGWIPEVPAISSAQSNDWQCLLEDLEEERRCGADLEEEILRWQSDFPVIAETLHSIGDQERKHRDQIRAMLMRSDPQAG